MPDIITNDGAKDVSLILSNDTFANLIINFLGKKEKLGFKENLIFVLERNDIEQFYHLLNQKLIREQIKIDHFLVNFYFDDGTSREISGIDNFDSYFETRDVYPIGVALTWNIIIKFPTSETIETQTIELLFRVDKKQGIEHIGVVYLLVECTNLSWGNEVLVLFVDKIKSIKKIESKLVITARKFLGYSANESRLFPTAALSYFASILFGLIIGTISMIYLAENTISNSRSANFKAVAEHIVQNNINPQNLTTLIAVNEMKSKDRKEFAASRITDAELNNILDNSLEYQKDKESFLLFIYFIIIFPVIGMFLIRIYLKDIIRYDGMNSYILTTKKSIDKRSTEMANKNHFKHYSITFITVGILISAIGSMLFRVFDY